MERKPYPDDLTEGQWRLLAPLLPEAKPGGRPRTTDLREVVNAILYLTRTGCGWRHLPHEFPPWPTVHDYYRAWRRDGTWQRIHDRLRERVRRRAGRRPEPRIAVLDSQSVKTTDRGGEAGFDAGKKSVRAKAAPARRHARAGRRHRRAPR
jgi:putative transposase